MIVGRLPLADSRRFDTTPTSPTLSDERGDGGGDRRRVVVLPDLQR